MICMRSSLISYLVSQDTEVLAAVAVVDPRVLPPEGPSVRWAPSGVQNDS